MAATALVELEGHIVDSLMLAKVLDIILDVGADYVVEEFRLGKTQQDMSFVRVQVTAKNDHALDALLEELQVHGVNRLVLVETDAVTLPASQDGVFPSGFCVTTNLVTEVRLGGVWRSVSNPEMDCGLRVVGEGEGLRVDTVPMHRVMKGEQIVVGNTGVRVSSVILPGRGGHFAFMNSEVSPEKPKGLLVRRVAERIRFARENGQKILVVAGPSVVHTGAAPELARLVGEGWVDVLFAGNGFATHDMEANVMGTSLGVSVMQGTPIEGGHSNHLRVINEIRRCGSIMAAVEDGYVNGGVMYECVQKAVPFVLAGSIRDDGPLPDVVTDMPEAVDRMRGHLEGVGVALMLASTLHAIATGNLLPVWVETYCVDINQSVVTKLSDRGSHQALGIVTDVGLFVRELAACLC